MGKKDDFEDPQNSEVEGVHPSEEELEEEAIVDPDTAEEGPEGLETEEVEDDDELTAEDTAVLEIKSQIEERLMQSTTEASAARVMAEDCFEGPGNIVGVGIGAAEEDLPGAVPGSPVVNVYVAEPVDLEEVRASLVDGMGIQAASSDDAPLNVIVTGTIDALSHRFRIRPAPGGVSCGHYRITAGTLGCLARGRTGARRRRVFVLSNNHVLANSNNARGGDPILQPGPADGGRNPADRIAILERFVPIDFRGRANYVDCAVGWAWHKLVRQELVYLRSGRRRFFRVSSRIRACRRGMLVGKSGRTTQLTAGRITDCSATIRVNYGRAGMALFRDQIAVRGLRGDFSRPGDSGSPIWTWDRSRNPVGLLFAGGGGLTFANKIARVLKALDIVLYT